jgi:hypothetical protein
MGNTGALGSGSPLNFMEKLISHLVNSGNALLEGVRENDEIRPMAKAFYRSLLRGCADLPSQIVGPPDFWKTIQIIGQQGLNILSWMDQRFPGAGNIRLTLDSKDMLHAEGRGPSYLSKNSLHDEPASGEGRPGPYWRGVEGVPKVKGSLVSDLMDERAGVFDWVVLYTMVHGIIPVPPALKEWTEKGRLSTFHDTAFLWDRVPGTRQATSTGAGHFQGTQLDLKQVVEGQGVQFNILYGPNGEMARVYAQKLTSPCLTVALPGHVDYMVNTGGLRFHDISFRLDESSSRLFGPGVKPSVIDRAPYAMSMEGTVVPALSKEVPLLWVKGPDAVLGRLSVGWLSHTYQKLNESLAEELIEKLCSRADALLSIDGQDVSH